MRTSCRSNVICQTASAFLRHLQSIRTLNYLPPSCNQFFVGLLAPPLLCFFNQFLERLCLYRPPDLLELRCRLSVHHVWIMFFVVLANPADRWLLAGLPEH